MEIYFIMISGFRTILKKSIIVIAYFASVLPACSIVTGDKPQSVEEVFLPNGDGVKVEAWIENLDIPWSLVFLTESRALVSERGGIVRLIKDGRLQKKPYALIDVAHIGEAGLLGLAVHPGYPREPYIYAMHTYKEKGELYNRVIRLKDGGDSGVFERIIIDGIPGGRFHDGGRINFGPDGMLYITSGETFKAGLAQDLKSSGGKILRITRDGNIPADNPFSGSPVYSYGHRNPQGIAWHPKTNKLFESEHGPSGEFGKFAHDEINIIVKGGNYGWPHVIGAPQDKSYIGPVVVWKKTTPPSGITFYHGSLLGHLKGDLFVATLKSEALIRIVLDRDAGKTVRIERWFAENFEKGKFGRLRDVVEGPDGCIYFLTNNRDGRGEPEEGDDRIYRIVPK